MSMRVTIATPEALINAANQLALASGLSEADVNTFGEAKWEDADGNRYSVASGIVSDDYPQIAAGDLTDRAAGAGADMTLVQAAQSAVVQWAPVINAETGEMASDPPRAVPGVITAIIHNSAQEAIRLTGLSPIKMVSDENL